MIARLLRFMVFLPLIEVVVIVLVWRAIGPWWTLGLLAAGPVAGVALLRLSPVRTLGHVHAALSRGRLPHEAVWEGAALGLAGLLLIVPGFFSDLLALVLLAGPGRRALRRPAQVVPPPPPGGPSREPLEGRFRPDRD
ncbi:FxsA family protein [Acidiferrobacter sp.]|uniref:FxsA family protein n=1 Tax=Acidiferrobacter sp. TaxID=1872107 RepID=UPI00260626A8|nr:FxsA family protein [Acidiferrobacter sp.]